MRFPLLVAFACAALGACSEPGVSLERLQPRAAEAIDPRVPIPAEVVAGPASPAVTAEIATLRAQADGGRDAFAAAAARARSAASTAGPMASESWIAAQQALSELVAARAPVTRALGELDALTARQVQAKALTEGDRLAILDASRAVAAIDSAQAAEVGAIQALIAR